MAAVIVVTTVAAVTGRCGGRIACTGRSQSLADTFQNNRPSLRTIHFLQIAVVRPYLQIGGDIVFVYGIGYYIGLRIELDRCQ